jgi:inosose dehydratase
MKTPSIRFGCQTYTWQMSLEKYRGKIEHIISTVKASGMSGLEPELCMLGGCGAEPSRFRDCLQSHGVTLGALCLVCDWRHPKETAAEMAEADAVMAMLRDYFPETLLALCQMPGEDRQNLVERQRNALACVNAVAARAQAGGISSAFHPNSPPGSVFRDQDD